MADAPCVRQRVVYLRARGLSLRMFLTRNQKHTDTHSTTSLRVCLRASQTGDQVVMHCIRDGTHASVVVAMLKEYPAGAKEPDADGRLPLHVAIESHADSDIVAALVEAYPEAAVTKSPEGKWPKDMVLEPGVPAMTSTVVFDTIRASDD